MGTLRTEAFAATLASVPSIGPKGLRALLDTDTPESAWETVRRGAAPIGPRAARAATEARGLDVREVWDRHCRAGIAVLLRRGSAPTGYPALLAEDPQAPAVLFSLGDPTVVDRHPGVALVGTRSATRYGLSIAGELGAGLAAAGVSVISGLALGIDGAAHEGALAGNPAAAPPMAVVAGSLDRPYPRSHALLWKRVAHRGALVSEAPMGAVDSTWRFPQRNRIIAALSQVVVVVECHVKGGSLHTVAAAATCGITVGAVPGSVRSPASIGTNALLADGCTVIRDLDDVLVALGMARAGVAAAPRRDPLPPEAAPDDRVMLEALGWERCTLEQLLARTKFALDRRASALERLAGMGLVVGAGGWWERT